MKIYLLALSLKNRFYVKVQNLVFKFMVDLNCETGPRLDITITFTCSA